MAAGLSAHQLCRSKRSQVSEPSPKGAQDRAIQQTIVSRRRGEVRGDRREQEDRARDKASSAGDDFHTLSEGEGSESETDLESLDEMDLWYATDDKAECEAKIGLREPRRKRDHGRERLTSNRSTSVQELKTVTTRNRCGALGHWENECPKKGTPPEIITV